MPTSQWAESRQDDIDVAPKGEAPLATDCEGFRAVGNDAEALD